MHRDGIVTPRTARRLFSQGLRLRHGAIASYVLHLTGPRQYALENTLVIAGSPRSGTTWLAEMLGTMPGSAILFEPLHPDRVADVRAAGMGWRTYRAPGAAWPAGEQLFERILRGELRTAWTLSQVPRYGLYPVRRWIVKFVRANLLLGWLTQRFPIPPPVLLLRHPCAVVSSQLRAKWWKSVPKPPRNDLLFADYPQLLPLLDGFSTFEERLAARWCLDTIVPLSLAQPYPFQLVAYEQLLADPARELRRICDRWRVEMPDTGVRRHREPSRSASRDWFEREGYDPLSEWTRALSAEQVERILRVVTAFGLDFYGSALHPDYTRLHGAHR